MTTDRTELFADRTELFTLISKDDLIAAAEQGIVWVPRGASDRLTERLVRERIGRDVLAWRAVTATHPAGWWLARDVGADLYLGDPADPVAAAVAARPR